MSLLQKQQLFALLLGRLLLWVQQQGWAVTLAEGYDDDGKGHMAGSLHYIRLAQDLNLFVGGTWDGDTYTGGEWVKDGAHPAWEAIGAKWKTLGPHCAWGGDFKSKDSNHLSLKHDGKA